MAQELAYVIITPYSLYKSRTGGILARLISRTGLDLAGARMFAPSAELVRKYADVIVSAGDPQDRRIQELIKDYTLRKLGPDPKTGLRRRVMVLLFSGEDAVRRVRKAVGNFSGDGVTGGETIRDTYGDIIRDEHDNVIYFEPAVMAAPTIEEARFKLRLWSEYSDSDGGVLESRQVFAPGPQTERTLVLIKPDNFRFATGRPGNMIDFFSRTGLFIVGIKLLQMSVNQACEFYGPVKEVLRTKLHGVVGARARAVLEKEFSFGIPVTDDQALGSMLSPYFADSQFENIIRFMAGRAPSECKPELRDRPGTEKCIALVYEGTDAVRKIRDVLGPTDLSKAPPGSIRREFGSNVMVNAAHASDSAENAVRELGIIGMGQNTFRSVVDQFYGNPA